jgi:SAM-dependent methyltransferase
MSNSPLANDPRLFAPSVARNRDPIRDVLMRHLPPAGVVLEIASGSGEHITHFASATPPELKFQPSDPDAAARASVDAWAAHLALANVRPAIAIDAAAGNWPITSADVVISINMIHIAPWAAAVGLIENAARILPRNGVLFLYGPFGRAGLPTAPSNDAFDADLKRRNPAWGLRDLEAVAAVAAGSGFAAPEVVMMPANNLSVIFRKLSIDTVGA